MVQISFWFMLMVLMCVNVLGGSVHTIKENAEAFVVASKENGLEVNAVKTTYWTYLETRMQNEVTVSRKVIDPLKGWNISDTWENP
jgi:hypothetical protein